MMYDAAGQTSNLTHRLGSSTLDSMNLGFDAVGRRSSVTRNLAASQDSFAYDATGQVTSGTHQTGASTLSDGFSYDAAGNWLSSQRSPNAAVAYLTNNLEQYTKVGAVTTTRDVNGNLLTATPALGKAMTLTWDAENRLLTSRRSTTGVTGPVITLSSSLSAGARVTSTYDVLHRRVEKVVHRLSGSTWVLFSTTRYTYDGWNIIHERSTQGSTVTNTRYTWGRDLSGNLRGAGGVGGLLMAEEISSTGVSTPHYYAADANGNITLMTTATGSAEGAWRYSSFGGPIPYSLVSSPSAFANKNPWRFSSKYLDAEVETRSGIYYYGYRHYSPQLGRWLSRDPIGERGGESLYEMCYNSCLNWFDYLGRDPQPSVPTFNNGWRNPNGTYAPNPGINPPPLFTLTPPPVHPGSPNQEQTGTLPSNDPSAVEAAVGAGAAALRIAAIEKFILDGLKTCREQLSEAVCCGCCDILLYVNYHPNGDPGFVSYGGARLLEGSCEDRKNNPRGAEFLPPRRGGIETPIGPDDKVHQDGSVTSGGSMYRPNNISQTVCRKNP